MLQVKSEINKNKMCGCIFNAKITFLTRGVFRTQSNIYYGVFLRKQLAAKNR